MNNSLRNLLPNSITFTGMVCAFSAVVMALHEELTLSGVCILVGVLLDALDGAAARRLGATSDFGLQLDSLVDVVAFGVAPSVLVYQYLRQLTLNSPITWVVCVGYMMAGAFRLARFNLLPQKKSNSASVGLAIPPSGAILVLGVLSNHTYNNRLIPAGIFPLIVAVLALLMVSRIRFPSLLSLLQRRWLSPVGLGIAIGLAIWFSPQLVGFGLTSGYVSFGLIRAVYSLVRIRLGLVA
ncbi:MAG: CDP-diacylglycerol--serine O-phosphatidyltransferase [Chloroflexota bacterium]|nr:CDP-diacylglycerol--serine O-phosphatidyltransferase [Chloroflexota bacterium]